ncbi:hypothetical protein GCM10011529_06920 [Polymorphobacter glacialis]|uniref:Carboxypeptidase regulatory-like domain-containing protein n=1 Tax=Sandarakinorhabdus glacialis TaxID=1614636 RepID=A0A916ZLB9_9SPHN|nr:carboxypeptidase regulatory-like domain-containing protein [Polymorphobacter glacialis]GGE03077.1 hypothetical protein GCM10011529_06920 [Polymorphobacter glacialis]
MTGSSALSEMLLPALLSAAVLLAWLRLALWQRSAAPADRSQGWRLALLVILQPLAAGLLYLTLVPPPLAGTAGTMVVATAGAPRFDALAAGDALVALPETHDLPGAVRVPDLATALRRHPGTSGLRIIGHGLPPRDRAAAAGLPLAFDPAPLPPGLTALGLPGQVAPGAGFRIGGSVIGTPGGRAELLDPSGKTVDTAALSSSGEFTLAGTARVAGPADFSLRLRDRAGAITETHPVPIVAAVQPPPRMLVVAGSAGPDLKYLRRWATDAGVQLSTSIAAGAGLDVGDAPARLDPSSLSRLDLLVLDERSWAGLGAGGRANVISAVRSGLGVVLRITGPIADETRRQWANLGLPIGETTEPSLRTAPGISAKSGSEAQTALQLTRQSPVAASSDTVKLLENPANPAIANWRSLGRGRIGLLPITDLYTLVIAGQSTRHAALWSQILGAVARPQSTTTPNITGTAERLSLCKISLPASVLSPSGGATVLIPEPSIPTCAAFYPTETGWHGTAGTSFYVAPNTFAGDTQAATWRLQTSVIPKKNEDAALGRGSSWPWFIAWLLVSATLWWFERTRYGRVRHLDQKNQID